jgi:DMSO/TMAO reductase YedYZ molybdopterin-dependent catalytic subunit
MNEEPRQTDRDGSGQTAGGGPQRPSAVRYNRKWFLVLGGAAVAAVIGAFAGIKRLAGSEQGGPLSDMFGPFPVRSAEDVPEVPAAQWVITVDGLVDRPLKIDHAMWSSLQRLDETVDFHCVEGWTVENVRWGGVAPAQLLEKAGVKPEGKFAVFHAYGGTYLSSVPLELVTAPQTLLADALNGEPLPAKHGGPVRLVVPAQLGYKNVKWVERIEITDAARAGYWEKRGYPEDAPAKG